VHLCRNAIRSASGTAMDATARIVVGQIAKGWTIGFLWWSVGGGDFESATIKNNSLHPLAGGASASMMSCSASTWGRQVGAASVKRHILGKSLRMRVCCESVARIPTSNYHLNCG
jgi:hypothetical protein